MSSDIRIRDYAEQDLDALLRCFRRSVHGVAARYYSAEQVAAWAPEEPDRAAWAQRLRTGRTFIADADGAVAGFARAEESGYIDLLYVDPAFERRGLGRRLLNAACDWAKQGGAMQLESEVSLAARAAFEGQGFKVDAEQTVERRGVRFTNYRMSRAV